jgi:hypothetical protein
MRKLSILLLLITFLPLSAYAQFIISGNVIDSKSGDPLPGVNVYLSGTTIGASTNTEGAFSFETNLFGPQELVASFIGFKTQIRSIDLGRSRINKQDFKLAPEVLKLNEIKVIASNNEFLRQLDLFKTFFIGFDNNSDQTFIINPEILEFEENLDLNRIEVRTSAPLIIHNNALGYRYEIELKEAYFDTKENTGFYNVYPRVIEMDAPNKRTRRRWNSNRKKSFEGSIRHFFKSLAENQLHRNDFKIITRNQGLINYSDSLNHIQRWYPSTWKYISSNYSVFLLNDDEIIIQYYRDGRSSNNFFVAVPEASSLQIRGFPKLIVTNRNGLILNSKQLRLFGEWSSSRFSDFLPLDYSN